MPDRRKDSTQLRALFADGGGYPNSRRDARDRYRRPQDRRGPREDLREIVIAGLKTGAAPEKIYATIKTGRMLTKDNMQFLTPAEIQEWADATKTLCTNPVCLEKAKDVED